MSLIKISYFPLYFVNDVTLLQLAVFIYLFIGGGGGDIFSFRQGGGLGVFLEFYGVQEIHIFFQTLFSSFQ